MNETTGMLARRQSRISGDKGRDHQHAGAGYEHQTPADDAAEAVDLPDQLGAEASAVIPAPEEPRPPPIGIGQRLGHAPRRGELRHTAAGARRCSVSSRPLARLMRPTATTATMTKYRRPTKANVAARLRSSIGRAETPVGYTQILSRTSPSSRGLGYSPFKAKTRVRIPLGTPDLQKTLRRVLSS